MADEPIRTVHLAVFLFPGSFVSEEEVREIASRGDVGEVPAGCFGYYVCDVKRGTADGVPIRSDRFNRTSTTYFGEVWDLERVRREMGDSILLRNMRSNGWARVVKTRRGNFQTLESGDVVVASKVPA